MPVLRLKNSFTKQIETFQPLQEGRVTMYSCGPTVYSFAHIGNFRSFLFADVLRRVLERNGYEVRHVMNITDVGHMTEDHLADASGEDKLAKAARELGSDPFKVAQHYEQAFVEDAKALRLKIYRGGETDDPELHPRATGHIPEMLAMIQSGGLHPERLIHQTVSLAAALNEFATMDSFKRIGMTIINEF